MARREACVLERALERVRAPYEETDVGGRPLARDVGRGARRAVDEDVVAREVGGEVGVRRERGAAVAGSGRPEERTGDGVARAQRLEGRGVLEREHEKVGLDRGREERGRRRVRAGAAGEAEELGGG